MAKIKMVFTKEIAEQIWLNEKELQRLSAVVALGDEAIRKDIDRFDDKEYASQYLQVLDNSEEVMKLKEIYGKLILYQIAREIGKSDKPDSDIEMVVTF